MRNKKSNEKEKIVILVTSLKEFQDKYLPKQDNEDIYKIDDPSKLGKVIADSIYEKNKHVLFETN